MVRIVGTKKGQTKRCCVKGVVNQALHNVRRPFRVVRLRTIEYFRLFKKLIRRLYTRGAVVHSTKSAMRLTVQKNIPKHLVHRHSHNRTVNFII